MALTGKGALSVRKKDLQNESSIAIGFQKLVFATKATGGETGIDLTALVTPPEMAALGFVNPSTAAISGANLKFFRRNFTLKSSLSGVLIDFLAFDVASSTRINFIGFTAAPGEIFVGTLDENAKTGLLAVDAQPIVATGVLSISATDFNAGTPFRVNQFPSAQVGSVLVFKDGVQQYRNVGNAIAAPTADGNYQEVDPGGGLGVIIRFNIADPTNAHNILVFNPGVAERPDGSMMAVIEALAGQLDQVIPTVAALAGVPETDFQATPNNVDLKAFGDKVTAQGEQLDDHEDRIVDLEKPIILVAGGAVVAPYVAGDPMIYPTVIKDSSGSYNPSTGEFICPKDGVYQITAAFGGDVANSAEMYANIDGVTVNGIISVSQAGGIFPSGIVMTPLLVGEVLTVRSNQGFSLSDALRAKLTILRVSDL